MAGGWALLPGGVLWSWQRLLGGLGGPICVEAGGRDERGGELRVGSGAGGAGPVASEPGKGSVPLPFLLACRGTGARTGQSGRQRREGEGADAALGIALALPPGTPQPPSLRTHSPSPGAAHSASLGLRLRPSPSCPGLCLGSRAAAPSAPSPSPKPPAHGQPPCTFGQPSLASSVTNDCPLPPSPSPGGEPSHSPGPRKTGVPRCFRGSSPASAPRPARNGPLFTHCPSWTCLCEPRGANVVAPPVPLRPTIVS